MRYCLAWFIGRYFQINETMTIKCEFSAVSVALNVPRMVFTLHLVVREAAAKWVAGTKGEQGDIAGRQYINSSASPSSISLPPTKFYIIGTPSLASLPQLCICSLNSIIVSSHANLAQTCAEERPQGASSKLHD